MIFCNDKRLGVSRKRIKRCDDVASPWSTLQVVV